MPRKTYWDLTERPHTERKLEILDDYIHPWAKIIFSQWLKKRHKNFKIAYYVDCFAGRGKYHKDGQQNTISGSPLIALNCAEHIKKKYGGEVELKCIFCEIKPKYLKELETFCKPYKGIVDYKIYPGDINIIINSILSKIGKNASLFFIDPCGVKDLKKKTVTQILNKRGPNDLLLNYICGAPRVLGKVESMLKRGEKSDQLFKLFNSVKSRYGLNLIFECFGQKDKEILVKWATEILKDTQLKYRSVYRMLRPHNNEVAYYLLFASRSPAAKKIVDYIFNKKDSEGYYGQARLPFGNKADYDLK